MHAELGRVAPFASHNGIVARAAERLVLVARGVDAKSLVVPEAGHLALRRGVRVEPARLPRRRPAGVHAWLLYAAEAYAAGRRGQPAARLRPGHAAAPGSENPKRRR